MWIKTNRTCTKDCWDVIYKYKFSKRIRKGGEMFE